MHGRWDCADALLLSRGISKASGLTLGTFVDIARCWGMYPAIAVHMQFVLSQSVSRWGLSLQLVKHQIRLALSSRLGHCSAPDPRPHKGFTCTCAGCRSGSRPTVIPLPLLPGLFLAVITRAGQNRNKRDAMEVKKQFTIYTQY